MTKAYASVDLETGGTSAGCVVYSLGAVMYDADGLGAEFYSVLSAPSQRVEGLIEEPGTLLWWSKQSAPAREVLRETEAVPEHFVNVLQNFSAWWREQNAKHFVALGSDFDGPILQALYKVAGIPTPWKFYETRCFRTMRALFPQIKAPYRVGDAHNALSDARVQALHASAILQHIRDMQSPLNHALDRGVEQLVEAHTQIVVPQEGYDDGGREDLGTALARIRKEKT